MRAAAAPELVEAAAELVAVPEPLEVAEAVVWEDEALAEEVAARAVAFLVPQVNDWQKVWPAKSLG